MKKLIKRLLPSKARLIRDCYERSELQSLILRKISCPVDNLLSRLATVLKALTLLHMFACTELGPPPGDITPPRVIEFTPDGEDVPIDSSITVRFSEPMSEALLQGQVVMLLSERVDAAFLKDIDSPPLSASRQAELVGCESSLDQDHVLLSMKPKTVLAPGCDYQVVVSAAATDVAGNPLVKDINRDNHGMPVGQSAHIQHTFKTHTDAQAQNSLGHGVVLSEVQANPIGDDSQENWEVRTDETCRSPGWVD